MKLAALIEIVLRIATFAAGLVPQMAGLAFFAFSVSSTALTMAVLALIALAVLTFLPRFRHTELVAVLVAFGLVAEALWELKETGSGGSEIAFSSAANLALGVLWILFHVAKRAFHSGAPSTDQNSS